MRKLPQLVAALATTFALTGAQAQALEEIKVSYQPALYWALPFYIATEKNWWAEVGLKPTFSTFSFTPASTSTIPSRNARARCRNGASSQTGKRR